MYLKYKDSTLNKLFRAALICTCIATSTATAATSVEDNVTVASGVEISIDVLANDTGDGLLTLDVPDPWSLKSGSVTLVENQLTYTSDIGFTGLDNIWYNFQDAQGNKNYGQVNITVTDPSNNPVVGVNDNVTVISGVEISIDVLANDTGNGSLILDLPDPWSLKGGSVTLADNQLTYTSGIGFTGLDKIWYNFQDAQGNRNYGQVNITVTSPFDPWYKPTPATTWQWQLNGVLNTNYNVDVYNIDLMDNGAETIQQLQASGKKVICYFSTAYENWRSDALDFNSSDLGNPLDDWPGERWVDIGSSNVRAIMTARMQEAKSKGCDGVEPDNVDAYVFDSDTDIDNNTGFNITSNDQVDYNIFLATTAHGLGLSIGLKNAIELIFELEPYFDFAINEECYFYEECGGLQPFLDNNKAVFQVEYNDHYVPSVPVICNSSNTIGFSTLILNLDLDDTHRHSCI